MKFKLHAVLWSLRNNQREGISIFYVFTIWEIIIEMQIELAVVSLQRNVGARKENTRKDQLP